MKVGYNQTVCGVMCLLGAAGVITCLLFETYALLTVAVIFLLYGAIARTRTYFEYEPTAGTIAIKAPLGPLAYHYKGDLRFMDGRLRCTSPDGHVKTVPVRRVLSNPEHWRTFRAELKKSNAVT